MILIDKILVVLVCVFILLYLLISFGRGKLQNPIILLTTPTSNTKNKGVEDG